MLAIVAKVWTTTQTHTKTRRRIGAKSNRVADLSVDIVDACVCWLLDEWQRDFCLCISSMRIEIIYHLPVGGDGWMDGWMHE